MTNVSMVITDQSAVIGGRRLFYRTGGKGKPVVLIHGIGASSQIWARNLGSLARNYQVYALDLIGFGQSEKARPAYAVEDHVNCLLNFMNHLQIEKASLIGHSMGGLIALDFRLTHPGMVEKIILVDSIALPNSKPSFTERLLCLPVLGELFMIFRSKLILRKFVSKEFYYRPELVTDEMRDPLMQADRAAVLKLTRTIPSTNRREAMKGIKAPTLILWGDQDRAIPRAHALLLQQLIPKSQYRILKETGHHPQIEASEEFNQEVARFLAGG
ncbi:MAG TPA: alpha/beta hydrolase [Nitrospiria bacterium]|nr:alpha/beta hydrolase [Nitrospiria bacterium]